MATGIIAVGAAQQDLASWPTSSSPIARSRSSCSPCSPSPGSIRYPRPLYERPHPPQHRLLVPHHRRRRQRPRQRRRGHPPGVDGRLGRLGRRRRVLAGAALPAAARRHHRRPQAAARRRHQRHLVPPHRRHRIRRRARSAPPRPHAAPNQAARAHRPRRLHPRPRPLPHRHDHALPALDASRRSAPTSCNPRRGSPRAPSPSPSSPAPTCSPPGQRHRASTGCAPFVEGHGHPRLGHRHVLVPGHDRHRRSGATSSAGSPCATTPPTGRSSSPSACTASPTYRMIAVTDLDRPRPASQARARAGPDRVDRRLRRPPRLPDTIPEEGVAGTSRTTGGSSP